jgi:hypothetical protein
MALERRAACGHGVCGEDCENRLLRIECCGGPTGSAAADAAAAAAGEKPGGGGSVDKGARGEKGKDKWGNCNVGGATCGNRQIGLKQGNVKVLPFMEEGMGWGLKVLEDVVAGQLVREYVGEVLTEQMLVDRMASHAKTHPNDVNMYVMELESGLYLDARQKGNVSRFINHSCGPNCELQKWSVLGVTRIGIFTTVDIAAGTALSYDYQFSTNEHGRFRCKCGSVRCRGSLSAEGYLEEASGKGKGKRGAGADGKALRLTKGEKAELLKKARVAEKRDVERSLEDQRLKACRLDLTARTLPGDPTTEVRKGAPPRHFANAREAKLFLPRNARSGSAVLRRKTLLDARAAARAAKA